MKKLTCLISLILLLSACGSEDTSMINLLEEELNLLNERNIELAKENAVLRNKVLTLGGQIDTSDQGKQYCRSDDECPDNQKCVRPNLDPNSRRYCVDSSGSDVLDIDETQTVADTSEVNPLTALTSTDRANPTTTDITDQFNSGRLGLSMNYPRHWYYYGFGANSDAQSSIGFAPHEMESITTAVIRLDIISGALFTHSGEATVFGDNNARLSTNATDTIIYIERDESTAYRLSADKKYHAVLQVMAGSLINL